MADQKFSQMALESTLFDSDYYPFVRPGTPNVNKRATMLSSYNYIASKLSAAGTYVNANTAITGATKTKISYDSNGLVIGGADANTDDILEGSTNLYHTNTRVLATALSGLSITGGSIASSDTILQAFGKLQNQVNGVLGGAIYQGVWNATTNSPSLTSSTGTKGHYYVVSVAGSTNLDGTTDWKVGDWAIFNGTAWDKVDNTDAVSSVNGSIGAISLTGTSNRITVTGNVWDIAATYVGQSSITTIGTITTGVWNGSAIGDSYISSASTWNAKLSATLTSAYLFIGNGSNVASGVPMSGDSTITNAGVVTNGGLKGSAIPTLAAGFLKYTGSAWSFDSTTYATDSLAVHLAGTETITGKKTFNPAVTASAGTGIGTAFSGTITANATNDILVLNDFGGTFSLGAITGTQSIGARFQSGSVVIGAAFYTAMNGGGVPKLFASGNSYLQGTVEIGYAADPTYRVQILATAANTTIFDISARGNSLLKISSTSSVINFGNYLSNPVSLITDDTRRLTVFGTTGNVAINTTTDNGFKLDVNGTARATKFQLSSLNTAPSSSSDTGTTGEIRIVNGFIYVCVASNTWQRSTLSTF